MKRFVQKLRSQRLRVKGIYEETDRDRRSLILFIVAFFVHLLRRVSLFEYLKRSCFAKGELVPAVFLESYLIAYWAILPPLLIILRSVSSSLTLALIAFSIAQVVQANIYHEFLRPALLASKGKPVEVAHSRLRSLVIGFCNYSFVTVLFGFAYWVLSPGFGSENPMNSLYDCVYFAFTYAWSAGSRSVAPEDTDWSIQLVIIAQVITTLFLVAALLSTAVATLIPIGERDRQKPDQGTKNV